MTAPKSKDAPRRDSGINLNTVLLGVLVGLSGWTLNRVQNLSEQMAAAVVTSTGQTRDIDSLRSRMGVAEAQIQANALAIARLQLRKDP